MVLGLLVGLMQTTACCDVLNNDNISHQHAGLCPTQNHHGPQWFMMKYQKVGAHLGVLH